MFYSCRLRQVEHRKAGNSLCCRVQRVNYNREEYTKHVAVLYIPHRGSLKSGDKEANIGKINSSGALRLMKYNFKIPSDRSHPNTEPTQVSFQQG
jgi:hypothetical protein